MNEQSEVGKMRFEVKNRWSGDVQFTAKITCYKGAPVSIKMGLAIIWAVKNGANLRDAYLRDAYLSGADLSGANLRGADLRDAYLSDAYLSGANLRGANLRGADLSGANLRGADLSGANLRGANLRDAYLRDAYLSGADLSDAYLSDAYLSGANLSGANLRGARWADNVTITKEPIQISGLGWIVNILDTHMEIGCELHSHEEWANFTDKQIIEIDGRRTAKFWKKHKATLLTLCASHAPEGKGDVNEGLIEAQAEALAKSATLGVSS